MKFKEIIIGEFSINIEILDEDNISNHISYKKKTLNYRISVYSNEGPIPHFHISDTTNNKGIDTCICIFAPMYFIHGNHSSILNNEELKILNKFLQSNYDDNETYWDHIVYTWDKNNPGNKRKYPQFRYTNKQPDYTTTIGFASNPSSY